MYFIIILMMVAAIFIIFLCGYYLAVIKQKLGRNWLYFVPITVAILMFNIVWAIIEMGRAGRY